MHGKRKDKHREGQDEGNRSQNRNRANKRKNIEEWDVRSEEYKINKRRKRTKNW